MIVEDMDKVKWRVFMAHPVILLSLHVYNADAETPAGFTTYAYFRRCRVRISGDILHIDGGRWLLEYRRLSNRFLVYRMHCLMFGVRHAKSRHDWSKPASAWAAWGRGRNTTHQMPG